MSQSTKIPVACFAPPLDDETIGRYRALVASIGPDQAEVQDAMEACLDCVEAWWALPASTRDATRWGFRHRGADVKVAEQPLETAHVQQLWDVTPWMRECQAMKALFEGVQAGESQRNGQKMEAWRAAVRESFIAKAFTAEEVAWLRSPARRMLRDVLSAMAGHGETATPFIDAVIATISPGMTAARIKQLRETMAEVDAKVTAVSNGDAESPVPRPQLESTAIRDAAEHLLWHAMELTLDREPMTADKL